MPKGYPMEHPYIICKTISKEQLEKFKDILKEIINSDEFLNPNQEASNILFQQINPLHKELKRNFQTLSGELKAGVIISGKCKLKY